MIDSFVTLSPIPGFRKWLEAKNMQVDHENPFYDDTLLTEEDLTRLVDGGVIKILDPPISQRHHQYAGFSQMLSAIESLEGLQVHTPVVQPILMKLATRYIVLEKHRGEPLDQVARFHIGNGAEVYRINYGADLSRNGMQSSFGMMVNYRYQMDDIADNQRKYELDLRIPVDKQVTDWIPLHVENN